MTRTVQDIIADTIAGHLRARGEKIAQLAEANGGVIPCTTCGAPAVAQVVDDHDTKMVPRGPATGPFTDHDIVESLRFACSEHAAGVAFEPNRDIDGWFSLSYSNYLVLPRSYMQSMPAAWQHRMVTCLDEMAEAFTHRETTSYKVIPGKWCYLSDIAESDYETLGITLDCEDDPEECRDLGHVCVYSDADGNEVDDQVASIFVPGPDPAPHYNRGRTRVPRADELATVPPPRWADCPTCQAPTEVVKATREAGSKGPYESPSRSTVYVELKCRHVFSGDGPVAHRVFASIIQRLAGDRDAAGPTA